MKTETSIVARQYRLMEWAEQIRDCKSRPSGMSVAEWCSMHDITTANYYYRFSQVRKACLEQVQETPVRVTKENRTEGSKHYMWVYRIGKMYQDKPIVLYDYQPTRNTSHPRKFLKDFRGICVTNGYQVYHTLEEERDDLIVAGCWAHARRRFDEAVKTLPKAKRNESLAYLALKQIQAIYREEKKVADESAEKRLQHRRLIIKPMVDAYFAWVKENVHKVLAKGKTHNGFSYSINQEKYLRVFLEDGEVPIDNNAAEQSIRGFCIGKKNWVMIDTIARAESSALSEIERASTSYRSDNFGIVPTMECLL